jgi:hypothetical protein
LRIAEQQVVAAYDKSVPQSCKKVGKQPFLEVCGVGSAASGISLGKTQKTDIIPAYEP